MDSTQIYHIGWGITCILLVGSSLMARKMAWGEVVRNILLWLVIFILVYGVILFRDQWQPLWDRAKADLSGGPVALVEGSTTVLTMQPDGHFHANAVIHSEQVDFLIDSGATTTALSLGMARKLGVTVDRSGFPAMVSTANGTIEAWPAQIPQVTVGSITMTKLDVLVSGADDGIDVLGMNWLSRLHSWRVDGNRMTLTP